MSKDYYFNLELPVIIVAESETDARLKLQEHLEEMDESDELREYILYVNLWDIEKVESNKHK